MLVFRISLLGLLLSLTTPAVCQYYSRWAPWPRTAQFESWYSAHSVGFTNISTGICNVTLQKYHSAFTAPAGSEEASELLSICYAHEACIITNIPGNLQANLNSATVVLGLMPTLLASIGPSVAEISLLSAHRPLLSFLISMGAPAVWPSRIFEYNDPIQVIRDEHKSKLVLNPLGTHLAILLGVGQYILAMGSVVNVVTTSIQVGDNSILAWGCTTTFTPLLWTTLACIIHLVAAVSYVIARQVAGRRRSRKVSGTAVVSTKTDDRTLEIAQATKNNGNDGTSRSSLWLIIPTRMLKSETTICANRPKSCYSVEQVELPRLAIFLNVVAGAFGFIHITLGIMTFSALQFILVSDVLNHILWRYVISTVVCRLILLIELAGMRAGEDDDTQGEEII